jgi:hypothetical protein
MNIPMIGKFISPDGEIDVATCVYPFFSGYSMSSELDGLGARWGLAGTSPAVMLVVGIGRRAAVVSCT